MGANRGLIPRSPSAHLGGKLQSEFILNGAPLQSMRCWMGIQVFWVCYLSSRSLVSVYQYLSQGHWDAITAYKSCKSAFLPWHTKGRPCRNSGDWKWGGTGATARLAWECTGRICRSSHYSCSEQHEKQPPLILGKEKAGWQLHREMQNAEGYCGNKWYIWPQVKQKGENELQIREQQVEGNVKYEGKTQGQGKNKQQKCLLCSVVFISDWFIELFLFFFFGGGGGGGCTRFRYEEFCLFLCCFNFNCFMYACVCVWFWGGLVFLLFLFSILFVSGKKTSAKWEVNSFLKYSALISRKGNSLHFHTIPNKLNKAAADYSSTAPSDTSTAVHGVL